MKVRLMKRDVTLWGGCAEESRGVVRDFLQKIIDLGGFVKVGQGGCWRPEVEIFRDTTQGRNLVLRRTNYKPVFGGMKGFYRDFMVDDLVRGYKNLDKVVGLKLDTTPGDPLNYTPHTHEDVSLLSFLSLNQVQ